MRDTNRFFSFNHFLRAKFKTRVHKLSIDAGFSCPNKENGKSGCIFCDSTSFSPGSRLVNLSISDQIDTQIKKLSKRFHVDHFLAYFQPNTNTYAPLDRLEDLYSQALSHDKVVGLIIGTRPDCVSEDVLCTIETVMDKFPNSWVQIELGLQSIDNNILKWMRRDHDVECFVDAVDRIKKFGFDIGTHIIWGTPFDINNDKLVIDTAKFLSNLEVHSVKIHNLYVPLHSKLATIYKNNNLEICSKRDYINMVVLFLEHLSSKIVVERLVSDVPLDQLLAPSWLVDKNRIIEEIIDEMDKRDCWQGKSYEKNPR